MANGLKGQAILQGLTDGGLYGALTAAVVGSTDGDQALEPFVAGGSNEVNAENEAAAAAAPPTWVPGVSNTTVLVLASVLVLVLVIW